MTNQSNASEPGAVANMRAQKRTARQQYLQLRRALPERDRARKNNELSVHLLEWLAQLPQSKTEQRDTGILGLYAALADEANLEPLARAARSLGWKTAYPKAHVETRALSFHVVSDEQSLVSGAYGIREPDVNAQRVNLHDITVLAVPGVAFTKDGRRLGYGGGYYDRLLPDIHAVTIGAAYQCQLAEALPIEPLDRPVAAVATEDGVFWCTARSGGTR